MPERVAVIGYGAITAELMRCLDALGETRRIVGVLDVPERIRSLQAAGGAKFALVDRLDSLLALRPHLVIEAAGHAAVRAFAAPVLARGIDLLIASIGALADEKLAKPLRDAARSGARLLVPSGAVAGIDGLLAARSAGLKAVTYSSLKPPIAWLGTPAEKILDLAQQRERVTFFEGSAREAAIQYPQNANVGATVALAGLGLDRTRVKLVADPGVPCPLGIIEAEGDFGTFRFEILAYAAPTNPKTSLLTAHSIVQAMRYGYAFPALTMLNGQSMDDTSASDLRSRSRNKVKSARPRD
jgi:aspartate dehydrogenase